MDFGEEPLQNWWEGWLKLVDRCIFIHLYIIYFKRRCCSDWVKSVTEEFSVIELLRILIFW